MHRYYQPLLMLLVPLPLLPLALTLPASTSSNVTFHHYHHLPSTPLQKRSAARVLNPCADSTLLSSHCTPQISPQALTVTCGEDGQASTSGPSACRSNEICIDVLPLARTGRYPTLVKEATCVAHSAFSAVALDDKSELLTAAVTIPVASRKPPVRYAQARLLGRYTTEVIKAEMLEVTSYAKFKTGDTEWERINGRETLVGKAVAEVGGADLYLVTV